MRHASRTGMASTALAAWCDGSFSQRIAGVEGDYEIKKGRCRREVQRTDSDSAAKSERSRVVIQCPNGKKTKRSFHSYRQCQLVFYSEHLSYLWYPTVNGKNTVTVL